MSLIYGIKTQDAVYLASDTRLTLRKSDGTVSFEDDFCKFHTFGKFMHAAVAGDAGLASYLLQKIQASDLSKYACTEFREKIGDFIRDEVGLYPKVAHAPHVVFIFAGHDPDRKDEMSMDKWQEYALFMQKGQDASVPVRITDPVALAMHKASVEQKAGKILELDKPYIGLFSVEVKVTQSIEVTAVDSEWASYLMFGPKRLTAKDAPPDLVVKLDIGKKAPGLTKQDVIFENTAHLINFFFKMIPKHQLDTVGGAIYTAFINEWGASFPEGELGILQPDGSPPKPVSYVLEHGGKFCIKTGDEIKPLRFVISFASSGSQMDIETF